MKYGLKCLGSLILALCMLCNIALADGLEFETLGKKEAEALAHPGEYEITLSVPGAVKTDKYSEIIVMVDASLSQENNFPALKKLLTDLGGIVFRDDGTMRLTLMGFGVGPRRAGSFYTVRDLSAFLDGASQSDLLQGRSATNCEVGFEYVQEYIQNSPKLDKTYVIYTSDGAANLDETPLNFSDWRNTDQWDYYKSWTAEQIIEYVIGLELERIYGGGTPIAATTELFPKESADVEFAKMLYGAQSDEHRAALDVLNEKLTAAGDEYVDQVLKNIHNTYVEDELLDEAEMVYGQAYSASYVEKAFIAYYSKYLGRDNAYYDAYMNLFYVLLGDTGKTKLTNRYTRAAEACNKLAQMDAVQEVFMVGYSGASNTWMNPANSNGVSDENVTYVYNDEFASVADDLVELSNDLVMTVYEDVSVIDPMSEWVTLDPNTIRIYEEDKLIYQEGEGWRIDNPPTDDPIMLEKNGDQYQITWKIKDGPLYYTDRYFLKYIVNVDENAPGFEYGKEYPANDPTYVKYTDENDTEQIKSIPVPDVEENLPPDDFDDGDKGITIIKEASTTGKGISGIEFSIYKTAAVEGLVMNPIPSQEEIDAFKTAENLVATITTDATGYAAYNFTKNGLEDGLYLFVEHENAKVEAPVNPFYVRIPMPDPQTGELMNVVEINPKNIPVDEEEDKPTPPGPDIPTDDTEEETEGSFVVIKHAAGDETKVLEGAQFIVYQAVEAGTVDAVELTYKGTVFYGKPVSAELTTDANGMISYGKLPFGLYFLVETKAPAGYNLLEEAIPVLVTETSNQSVNAVKIPNEAGFFLPETGGRGTAALMLAGLALCGASIVLLLRRKAKAA